MIKITIEIINKLGLHARASAKFVSTAARFQSDISVIKGTQKINGKSIMAVMMLAAKQGSELSLEFEGPDEQALHDAIVTLINNRFGEPE